MTPHSVYWIHHPDHTDMFSQGYIGVSKNVKRRFVEHFRDKQNRHLMFAIEKYGWDNLIKKEILISDEAYCLDIESKLRPTSGIGWNLIEGGGKPPVHYGHKRLYGNTINKNRVWTESARKKRSTLNRVRFQDPDAKEKFSKARLGIAPYNKGKKMPLEVIEKLRIAHLGKPSPRKGMKHTAEAIEKLKKTFLANPWTCPHCNKTGYNKGSGNRWHFDNCKEK